MSRNPAAAVRRAVVRALIKARDGRAAGEAATRHIRAAFEARLMQLDEAIIDTHPGTPN